MPVKPRHPLAPRRNESFEGRQRLGPRTIPVAARSPEIEENNLGVADRQGRVAISPAPFVSSIVFEGVPTIVERYRIDGHSGAIDLQADDCNAK